MRRWIVGITTVFAAVAMLEIICIEFQIGLPVLSDPLGRIVLSMSYAFVASWLFYVLVVVIPDALASYHRSIVAGRRCYHLYHSVNGLLKEVSDKSSIRPIDSEETLKRALDNIDQLVDEGFAQFMMEHISTLIRQTQLLSQFMEPRLLHQIDRIDLQMMTLDFGTRIEGETLGDAMASDLWRLRELNEQMHDSNRRLFSRVDREIQQLRKA